MGIPHLITHLRPYALDTDLKGKEIIIDGPGFAYHVYHGCLSIATSTKNPFESLPEYVDVAAAAIKWLEEVESYGLQV